MSASRRALVLQLKEQGITNPRVLELLSRVPRHLFLDDVQQSISYQNHALPIGHGQTISQPWVVARMTELLCNHHNNSTIDQIFEIGTGSGYQTAILASLAKWVVSIERIEALHRRAGELLTALQIENITLRHDSHCQAGEQKLFDAVIFSAAVTEPPQDFYPLIKDTGVIIAPVGDHSSQFITVIKKERDQFVHTTFEEVRFVPYLTGLR